MDEPRDSRRERWQQIEQICGKAIELSTAERASMLDEACAGDPDLRREVESLLAVELDASSFLEISAGEMAADLLAASNIDLTGRRLGSYTIGERIGSGGMGDVYRAHDEHLGRDVALKILPGVFADQEDRVARFMAEARVLGTLNHPNIAAIHGLEEAGGVRALVLEFVEGSTLADMIGAGRVPVEDALPIARQIAEALETAHECGIVHRDLKPSNIIVRPDGTVKLLDFGLATMFRDSPPDSGTSNSVIGTVAYASPEQIKGRPADRRSDIWAFGALVFELLSGRPAFTGETTSEIMTTVLKQSINWSALPASTPASIHHLLMRCLERDVRLRLRDIGEARIALEQVGHSDAETRVRQALPVAPRRRLGLVWLSLATLAAAAFVVAAIPSLIWRAPSTARPVSRLTHVLPAGQSVTLPASRHVVAVSPDGRQIAYVTAGGLQLRSMSKLDAQTIRGTEMYGAVTTPVFSPTGDAIAFWSPVDRTVKRIPVAGGEAVSIAPADDPFGMSWYGDSILFGQGGKGIIRVRAQGGTLEPIVRVDEGDEAYGPQMLPDGDHVLFTLAAGTSADRWDRASIVVQSLSSGQRTTILSGGTDARYIPSGHLVYGRSDTVFGSGTLFGATFDASRMTVGAAAPLIDGVRTSNSRVTGALQFDVSASGTLVYVPGSRVGPEFGKQQLVLADRAGKTETLSVPPDNYRAVRVSPDGSRIALEVASGKESDIYVYDAGRSPSLRPLTFGGQNRYPVWSADGKQIAFQSDRERDAAIFTQPADGSGAAARLTKPGAGESHVPECWSPDGRTLLVSIVTSSRVSLATLSTSDTRMTAFGNVRSAIPVNARFSLDGRWVAYNESDATAGSRIFVEPFPATGARYPLVVQGPASMAHKPVWSRAGELIYVPRLGALEAVRVVVRPALSFGTAVPMPRPFNPGAPAVRALYDILPDDRLVGVVPIGDSQAIYSASHINVVLNWFEELKGLAPANR